MDFATALNESMEAAGWTDERLSVELNGAAKASQVRKWRRGMAQPRLEQYRSILKVLPGFAGRIDGESEPHGGPRSVAAV